MNTEVEYDVEDLGVASIETKGAPNGITEPGGRVHLMGISDLD